MILVSAITQATHPGAPENPNERVSSVDTIRGAALLGILAINIIGFASLPVH